MSAHPPRLPLFCVPYAGGTARSYRRWGAALGPDLEAIGVDRTVPGDRRPSIRAAAAQVVRRIAERTRGGPYLLLGHSMGSLVAYEAALLAEDSGLPAPDLLIVSARNPPHLRGHWGSEVLALEDRDLLARLDTLGGVPSGLSASLATALFLPGLRADLHAALAYTPAAPPRRVDAPLLVLAGRTDPLVSHPQLGLWSGYSARECTVRLHRGGHFALLDRPQELSDALPRRTVPVPGGVTW
ncbi:thioesterase II family protein [Kitasatospora sp. NPDC004531]